MLIQLIYVSTAAELYSNQALDKILESSVKHNARQAITGMLLYYEGSFMQVLEGEVSAIDETYLRICNDHRHYDLSVLSREAIINREFPKWSMGYRRLTDEDASKNPAFAPFFSQGFNTAQLGIHPGISLNLLKQFCRAE
jgi:hypothetical protein